MGIVAQAWTEQKVVRCVPKVWPAGQELSVGKSHDGKLASSRWYGVALLLNGWGSDGSREMF